MGECRSYFFRSWRAILFPCIHFGELSKISRSTAEASLAFFHYYFFYHYYLLKAYVCSPNGNRLYWEIGIFNTVFCGGITWAPGSAPLFNSYKTLPSLTLDTGLDSRPFQCNLHQQCYFNCNHITLYASTKAVQEKNFKHPLGLNFAKNSSAENTSKRKLMKYSKLKSDDT